MIAKISRGKGFRGVFDYLLSKHDARILNSYEGKTARDLSAEFSVSRNLRPDIEKPVWHVSLSLSPDEHLDDETWLRVVETYLAKMGIDATKHQHIVVRHFDTNHDHVHLVVNRISMVGGVWIPVFDIRQSHKAMREIEREFGLTVVERKNDGFGEPKLKRGEVEKALREQEPPVKLIVSEAVKEAVADKPDIATFINRLNERGIIAIPNVASTGRMNGFSFAVVGRVDGDGKPIVVKGSDVGAKWSKLKELVDYEVERDGEFLKAVKSDATRRLDEAGSKTKGADAGRDVAGNFVGDEGNVGYGQAGDGDEPRALEGVSVDRSGVSESVESGDGRSGEVGKEAAGSDEDMEIQSLLDIADDDDVVHSWVHTAGVVAEDAIHAKVDAGDVKTDDQVAVKAHIYAKRKRWEEQSKALGAQKYRITCVSRVEGKGTWVVGKKGDTEEFYTAEQVMDMIEMLSAKNAQGYDIYVTPIDPTKHYFLLDDLKKDQVDEILNSNLGPSLVMESSKDNYQVLFVCERRMESANDDKEDEAAKQVLNALKKRYGADQNVGLTQPFRMAGFNNKKQGRNNFIVKLHYWSEQISEKIRETIDKVKKAIVVDKQEKTVNVSRAHKPSDRTQPSKAAYEDFKKLWRRHRDFAYTKVKSGEWEKLDLSVVDFRAAKDMLRKGYDAEEVVLCLYYSPKLDERHADIDDYVERTVKKAEMEIDRDDGR